VLSFDTREALDTALASPEWQAAIADVGDMRGRRIAVMGEELTMVLDGHPVTEAAAETVLDGRPVTEAAAEPAAAG
jgi:hypothetical protein